VQFRSRPQPVGERACLRNHTALLVANLPSMTSTIWNHNAELSFIFAGSQTGLAIYNQSSAKTGSEAYSSVNMHYYSPVHMITGHTRALMLIGIPRMARLRSDPDSRA